jgi:prepilin-type N-terminal cleavage/methylation domain-containing protein
MRTPSSSKLRRGFTILELMVAMAITTIIVTVLVGVTSVALDTWSRSRAEVRASRQAKSMVDTMAHDLEALVSRRGNSSEWLYAKTSDQSVGPNSMKSSNAIDLIFFTAATDRYDGQINGTADKGGDVSCVSYSLDYQDPVEGKDTGYSTFALYRLLVNPDDTYANILGKPNLKTAFGTRTVNEVSNFVCENIYQFTVVFNVEVQKSGIKYLVPVSLGPSSSQLKQFQVLGTGLVLASSPSSEVSKDELKEGRLVSAQISLTVMTDFALNQLRTRTFKSEKDKSKFLATNSYQYSKVVELPGL